MATRRSRLSVRPNIGPKPGGPKPGLTKTAAEKKGKQQQTSPKKETLERLRKKVSDDDDIEKDVTASKDESESVGQIQQISNKVGNADNDGKSNEQSSEVSSPVLREQSVSCKEGKDTIKSGSESQNKTTATGKDGGEVVPVLQKLPVSPKNKVQMITRNRLPKARPNLTDAGRPRKAPDLNVKGGTTQSSPSSPLKSPRPIISQSPDKALSSLEKSTVVARELQVHYPVTDVTDNVSQTSKSLKSDAKSSVHSGETTVAERRHRNLSGVDVPPIIERRQRQMSTSEAVVGEKRHRHISVAETSAPKRKKHVKVDAPTDVPVDRTKIKMGDLIYWNPSSNPMKKKPGQGKKKKKSMSPSDDDEEETSTSLTTPTAEEEKLDDPEPMEDEAMPVPQVKIGPDGNIIINEESLVIKNNDSIIEEDGDIIDETDTNVTYTSFRKQRQKLSWSEKETEKFYKALSYIGTDFSLIHSVFPKRSRNEIKKKFALEDKKNRDKVEAALRNKKPFNMAVFQEEAEAEEEITKPARKTKRAKKENKTVEKSAKKMTKEWRYYYKDKEGSEEDEAVKAAQKRQQVEEARRRLLASRNSSQNVAAGVEESNEIVEILMNMSKGSNPVPPAVDRPHVENVMVKQSGMPVVDIGTNTEQLVQLLQTSGQAALIGDNVNEPLILVYNRPTAPGEETVIHVYKIQPEKDSSVNVPSTSQQPVSNENVTELIDINLTPASSSGSAGYTNSCTSDFLMQGKTQVDINLANSSETQEGQRTSVLFVPNQTELINNSSAPEPDLHNYYESTSLGDSTMQSREQLVTNAEVPNTSTIEGLGGSEQEQPNIYCALSCNDEETADVQSIPPGNISNVDPVPEFHEQYIDDMTSVVSKPLVYTT
ncbi:transcription factor TFIIIB component B'' homolog [Ylistrum balloti]|uniref:transcription factor TFIIIB component B'' homolog n=1 Tax=Ylistrum balloti TaxID=509963 RepID=UPI002905EDD5|nr:transcription factor TFIIIB component B'' homolog [Ylistrum balloti]